MRFSDMGINYTFEEEINGLLVELVIIDIAVGRDQKIVAIRGTAVINQNFGIDHPLDAQSAIEAVNRHVEAEGLTPPSRLHSDSKAYLIYKHWYNYRTWAPWWFVDLARGAEFYVDPDSVVSSAVVITP